MRRISLTFAIFSLSTAAAYSQETQATTGKVKLNPGNQRSIPAIYRLKPHEFNYQLKFKQDYPLSGFEVYHLTFPSAVKSPHEVNNTVHADYYRPKGKKNFPCVVVLHITGGDQTESKLISSYLAKQGIGAVFMQMAYYGPRRPAGPRVRMLSFDIKRSMDAVRQTVLDVRRAAAWMESRDEIDKNNTGVVGTSLGGFMAALSGEMEPSFEKVVVLLAGGGLVDAFYEHPQAKLYVAAWELFGGSKEQAKKIFADYDPLTCAGNLRDRKLLMIAASKDEIVPPKMAKALWNASGRQKIVWINTTHYGAVLYLVTGLRHITAHIEGKK